MQTQWLEGKFFVLVDTNHIGDQDFIIMNFVTINNIT
jgi:hypothetical protein